MPNLVSFTYILFQASYAYTTTLSPVQYRASSYLNRLQHCSSNSPITARQAGVAIRLALILKGNLLNPCTKNVVCIATHWNT